MTVSEAYRYLFTFALIFMGVFIGIALSRCIRGPETCDRILAVNMTGTAVICCISVLTVLLGEGWLCDISFVYVLINSLSVAILAKVYLKRCIRKDAGSERGGKRDV